MAVSRASRNYPVADWQAAYAAGRSSYEIARDYGAVTEVTVRKYLRAAGVEMRPCGRKPGGQVMDYAVAQNMLDAGAKPADVARHFSVTQGAVRLAFLRGALKRRDDRAQATIRHRAEFIPASRCRSCGAQVVGVDRCEVCR